jgi:hypothetical protein
MTTFNYTLLTNFLKIVLDDITLKGIENISSVSVSNELYVDFDEKTGDVVNDKE